MRHFAIFAIAFSFFLFSAAAAQEVFDPYACDTGAYTSADQSATPSVVLKVMSINLRHNKDFWEDRFPLIADEIVRLKPDIIGMQEMLIGINQSATLLGLIKEKSGGTLNYEKYEKLKFGIEGMSGEGITIFSRYPIVRHANADLGYGRPGLFTAIKVNDKLTVDMFNTHLHNKGGDEVRLPQARTLMRFAAAMNTPGNIAFLTGDMNSNPDSATIGYFRESGFIDTFLDLHGDLTAQTGMTGPVILSKDNAVQDFRERIDYVFVRPAQGHESDVKIIDSIVCFKNFNSEGLYPSDHLGVMTTFEILTP